MAATRRVLLVDDLPDDREIYGSGLQSLGYHVTISAMADALEVARRIQPAAIVLHLGSSKQWLIADELRHVLPDVPVICLTAAVRPDRANRDRARATPNCAAFVGKPCSHVELAEVIQQVLRGKRRIEITRGSQRQFGS